MRPKRFLSIEYTTILVSLLGFTIVFISVVEFLTSALSSQTLELVIGGVIGLVIPLAFYYFQILFQKQDEVLEILKRQNVLGKEIADDPRLVEIVERIVDDYKVITKRPFPVFEESMFKALKSCQDLLDNLAEGELIVPVLGETSSLIKELSNARKSVKFVRTSIPSYMGENGIQTYFKSMKEAKRHGVSVTGIWLLSKEDLLKYSSLINKEARMDIKIFVAEKESVPIETYNNFALIDAELLITTVPTGVVTRYDVGRENISIDTDKVKRAERNFDLLLNYSTSVKEYYESETTTGVAEGDSRQQNNS